MVTVEKHDLILYASGVTDYFDKDVEKLRSVELAIEALERGEAVACLVNGTPTGTQMRATRSKYIEEKIHA